MRRAMASDIFSFIKVPLALINLQDF